MNIKIKFKYLLIFVFLSSHFLAAEDSKKNFRKIAKVKWESLFKRNKSQDLPSLKRRARKKSKKLKLREVKPPSSSTLYYAKGTDEAELDSIQNEEINYLFKMLRTKKSSDLLIRLGTLYVEKARFISFKIQSDYEKKLSKFKEGTRKTKPVFNLKPAETYNRKALKVFQKIITLYPKHPRRDEVLFFLGSNSYELGLEVKGAKYFNELLKKFPKSQYLYESQFQLGEYYYTKGKWQKSYIYYAKVASKKRGKFYFFALYKLAWTNYKQGRVSKGLSYLKRIITESSSSSRKTRVFTFATEAEEDLVLFYNYSRKNPARAEQFFTTLLDAKKAQSHLKRLAYSYRNVGNTKGVILLFNYLIEKDPESPTAFDYKYEQVQALYDSGSAAQARRSVGEWVTHYGASSLWAKANSSSRVRKSRRIMEVTLRDYALRNHQSFRKSKSKRAKNLALYFYKVYFNEFDSDQMAFFYAEILFDSKKYKTAAQRYEELIKRHPSSKYLATAYQNQILALDKTLPSGQKVKSIVGRSKSPIEFPSEVQAFLNTADRYIKKFPNNKNTSSVAYRVAALHYSFNHLKEAAIRFKDFSEKYPSASQISSVGGVLLDIYNKNKDYKSLEELASKFVKNSSADKSLIQESNFILQQLSFKKAQDLALNKKFLESANLYQKFARSNPSSFLTPVAYFNAGLNYEKMKDYGKAIQMHSFSVKNKSAKHLKIRKKSSETLPTLYEKLGYYQKAADGYASYARSFPQGSKVKSYWYNAGIIYDALNRVSQAVKAYTNYHKLDSSNSKGEAMYLIATLYERNQNWKQAINYYKRYVTSRSPNFYSIVKSSFKISEIYRDRLKQKNNAKHWYKETIAFNRKLKAGLSYAAQSQFLLVYDVYKKFKSVKLPRRSVALNKAVQRKTKLLNELEDRLKSVVRYNDREYIIAALTLTGLAKQEMAEIFHQAPIPKSLDKNGQEQYRAGVRKIITPYLKEAAQSYKLAITKSKSLEVGSDWVGIAYDKAHSFVIKNGEFKKFKFPAIKKETLSLQLLDDAGTAEAHVKNASGDDSNLGVSKKELTAIAFATKSGKERRVLNAVSQVLNRDPKNQLALNSLGLFYIKNNKPRLGVLIFNRMNSKNNPSILNNLGMASLKQRETREAISYFTQAAKKSSSHIISRINLGNIFIQKQNYHNALTYLGDAHTLASEKWSSTDQKMTVVLNNYGVALQGLRKWKAALRVFNELSRQSSPAFEILFNKALTLAEGFRDKNSQNEAKSLVKELKLSSNSVRFKIKLDKILKMMRK